MIDRQGDYDWSEGRDYYDRRDERRSHEIGAFVGLVRAVILSAPFWVAAGAVAWWLI